jgi:D-glycerate 3-kinase
VNGKSIAASLPPWQREFLEQHQLDASYLLHAQQWFAPLAESLYLHHSGASGPVLVAVNGCQGSGKTTVCDYLAAALQANHSLAVIALSLDDFYLTREQRRQLATTVHPLLATRGVPGTHDMALLGRTLDALLAPARVEPVRVPRFDKSVDDRCARTDWELVEGGVNLVLLEGWCLGARPQSAVELVPAVNELERLEDPGGSWRRYVNEALERDFLPLYERVDQWVMLRAPSFSCVQRWRLEQEQKLASKTGGRGDGLMDAAQLSRFIQYYQRITQACLDQLPSSVNYLYTLDEKRQVSACTHDGKEIA